MAVTTIDWMDLEQSQGNITEGSVVTFHHRAIVASILIALTPLGLFGNALVIIAVVVAKKLHTITNILVTNLAVTDFITCLCFPFLSAGFLSQTGSYPIHDMICATIAGVVIACVCCSSSTLLAIAFVRWYVITRSVRGHQGIHTPKKVVALVVLIWVQSSAQNTRGRWAIRPRELHNRPRQVAHGGDCKIKNRPRGIIKYRLSFSVITLTQY